MNKLAAGLIFVAFSQVVPVVAQTKPENNLSPRMRIYEPKYLKRERAEQVARFVGSVIGFVSIHWEPVVNGLVLSYGAQKDPQDDLDKAEALVRRFDVPEPPAPPKPQIEMTLNLINAFGGPGDPKGSVPPELASVVKEMKGALPYSGFNLVDTIQVSVRDGVKLEDALPVAVTGMGGVQYFYSVEFHEPSVSADGKTVSVQHFRFAVKVPAGSGYQDVSIATPLTIYEGQKQVLGKIKLSSMSSDDLFVVLSCKVK
jgi:hypothetical protein